MTFILASLMSCTIILVDYQLHGRTGCRNWIIWNCFPGMVITNYQILYSCCHYHMLIICFLSQAKCLETGEAVAIKKVLQDRRYKNRELQLMRVLDHPNVISLKHCFFSTTSTDELFLNLVMEYVPESMYRVLKHYSNANQRMPIIYVKLYMYQVSLVLFGNSQISLIYLLSA